MLVSYGKMMTLKLASLMHTVLGTFFHEKSLSLVFSGHGVRIGRRLGSQAVDARFLRLSFPRSVVA